MNQVTDTTDQASEVTTRTDPVDTAEQQVADLAAAAETLGEGIRINPTNAGNHTPETMDELRDNARRALLKRIAEDAAGNAADIANLAAALSAVEYLA